MIDQAVFSQNDTGATAYVISNSKPVLMNQVWPLYREGAKRSAAFFRWFEGSKVVNKDGTPLPVYRGEYGPLPTLKELFGCATTNVCTQYALFLTRLGSLSFGSARAASLYGNTTELT